MWLCHFMTCFVMFVYLSNNFFSIFIEKERKHGLIEIFNICALV